MRLCATRAAAASLLMPIAIIALASCSLGPLTGRGGSVAIAVKIPSSVGATELSPVARSILGGSAANRFVNPNTRRIEAVLAARDGSFAKSAVAQVSAGDSSASIVFGGLASGEYEATVTLYDGSDLLLSRGSSPVTVNAGRESPAIVYAVPVTELTIAPGPGGLNIPDTNSGAIQVYRVDLPKDGAYALGYQIAGTAPSAAVAMYDSQGRRESLAAGSTARSFSFAARAGTHYAVLEVPTLASGESMTLSVDADMGLSVNAYAIYVDPSLSVMDRQRPFTIGVACGFDPDPDQSIVLHAPDSSDFYADLDAEGRALIHLDLVGLASSLSRPVGYSIEFTDALLGIRRTGALATPVPLPGAPRTFAYIGPAPAGTAALGYPTLADACSALAFLGDAIAPAAVLQTGSYEEKDKVSILSRALVIGGCTRDWSRTAVHGSSSVALSRIVDGLAVASAASGSVLDGLALVSPEGEASIPTGADPIGLVSILGDATMRDCSVLALNKFSCQATTASMRYGLVSTQATVIFDRCSLIGGSYSVSGTATGSYAFGILSGAGDYTLTLVNSLVYPGVIESLEGSPIALHGVKTNQGIENSATLYAIGSTISGGDNASGKGATLMPVALDGNDNCSFHVLNCLLLAGPRATDISSSATFLFNNSGSTTNKFGFLALGIDTGTDKISIFDVSSFSMDMADWNGGECAKYDSTPAYRYPVLGLASFSPKEAGFLAPTTGSPADLLRSGADLSADGTALALVGIPMAVAASADLRVDRDGKPRSGNGETGYTIGAYERD